MSSVDDQTSGHTPSETSSEELQGAGSQVEENEEDDYTALTLDEIPSLLKDLESTDETVAIEAATKLDAACMRQEEFMAESFLALDVARTIHLANQKDITQALRYSLVDYLASLCNTHPDLRAHFAKFVPELISLISIPGESHLYRLASILNAVTEDIPTSHADVLSALKALYHPILQTINVEDIDSERATPLIASFTTMFVYGSEILQRLFVEARAVAAAIVSSNSSSPTLRLAVAYALPTLAEHADKIREWTPEEDKELKEKDCLLIVMSLSAAFALLDGTNREVDDQAVDFIHGMQDQYAPYVCALLEEQPNMRKFLLTLAGKPPNTLNSRDHMLMKACEIEDMAPFIIAGFKDIWQDTTIPVDVITQLFSGLSTSFLDHRKYACQDGLSDFVVHRFASASPTDKVKLFKAFDEFMDEQMVGGYLLKSDGAIRVFIDGLKDPIPEIIPLSSSILRKVVDSHLDDVSQRPIAVQRLTEPDNLALILDVVRTPNPVSSSAGFELLGHILAGEDGTESFGYDEDEGLPPPPCPLKDLIVTPDLVKYAVSLLHKKETAVGALNFLSYACWGYARGREITRDAFKPVIPTADVFFFDNLYGDFVSRASGRRKRAVAQAAVDAGAFERVTALLEKDYETVEERRAAVEGFRVIVAAPEMDNALARNSATLPRAVGRLVADETFLSLKHAQWAINIASNDDDPDTFAGWHDFASPEVVRALTNSVSKAKEEFPEVERAEGMSDEEFTKLESEWRQKMLTAEEEYTTRRTIVHEIMTRLAPVLKPFANEIVGPVFEEGTKSDEYTLLQLANIYGGDEVPSEALLSAVETFLATDPPLSVCQSVVSAGTACATALQSKGLVKRLLDSLNTYSAVGETDEEDPEPTPRDEPSDILTLLSGILEKIDDSHKPEIQSAFFASPGAIAQTCKLVADTHNVYEAFSVAGCLLELLKDHPDGVKALDGSGVYESALHLFDHRELEGSEDSVAGLVAALCCLDEAKLVKLVQQQIAQLQPPPEAEAPAANKGKKGGQKGGGKKKKYKPRLPETMVWTRIAALADTTSAAKQALLDAGVIEFAQKCLVSSKNDDIRKVAILLLTRIADGNKETLSRFSDIIHLLTPSLVEPDETTEACLILIKQFVDEGVLDVIFDACVHDHILKLCSANPVERDVLFAIISGLLKQGASYATVAASLQADIAEEHALEDEKSWGYSLALRQLAEMDPGVEEKRLFGEKCVLDHALRLLNTADPQASIFLLITKGAMLAGDLCHRLGETARAQLEQIGVKAAFIEERLKLVEAAAEEPFETELEGDEGDEAKAEHTRLLRTRKDYLPLIQTAITLVSGGEVVDYTPEYGV